MTDFYLRENASLLLQALKNMPVVVLSGMRQTGKSTLLRNIPELKKRKYITFDDFNTIEAARRDPEGLLSGSDEITIDEAQKFPDIMNVIKRLVDQKRRPGQFLLSGSANFLLLKTIAESLAGRAVYLTLYPFSFREQQQMTRNTPTLKTFIETGKLLADGEMSPVAYEQILKGGMPSVALGEVEDPAFWFRGYEQTYLERDIRALSQVADMIGFRNLLQMVALRNGQILNHSELSRDAKLSATTTSRYLSLMEASFVTYRLSPHLANPTTRLIKSPKIYLSDSGLAAHLAGIRKLDKHEPLRGNLFESYVAQNLLSILSVHYPDSRMTFWNVQGRHEVDFVIELDRETVAIEVKYGSRFHDQDLSGLKAFMENHSGCRVGLLAYNGREVIHLSEKMWAVPVSILLS